MKTYPRSKIKDAQLLLTLDPSDVELDFTDPTVVEKLRGHKGDRGESGAKGEKGDPGRDGRDGKDGLAGKDGRHGKDGKDGLAGAKGDKGDPGYTPTREEVEAIVRSVLTSFGRR